MEREVTLSEILAARERRAARQQELLRTYGTPLVCFTMNIAGPVKRTPLVLRAFHVGCNKLRAALCAAEIPILDWQDESAETGCLLFCAADGDALFIKRLCTAIEDETPLGRLFDMDVLDRTGAKLDRETVGGGDRGCIVCGASGRGCASRRVHSVEELQAATRRILMQRVESDSAYVAALAVNALTDEVHTTPKPGLVDENNSGSHRDMTLQTFHKSIAALAPYWKTCADLGLKTAALPPAETFSQLRIAGLEAEKTMLRATSGVNTHKGAVFTLGVLCGAVGRLQVPDTNRILAECAAMTEEAVQADFAAISACLEEKLTAGGRLYRKYGLKGIRGEVVAGLPSVQNVSLPVFEAALKSGKSRNDAGVIALLHLIALGADTNMISRGGMETATRVSAAVKALLDKNPMPSMAEVKKLDADFIRQNLSPGGCADLLAVTYFLYDLKK